MIFSNMMIKFCLILFVIAAMESIKFNRPSRQFSLFSVVSFPNDPCTSSSSTFPRGTCLALGECTSNSGTAQGNCAAGFGVCCIFVNSECGDTISQNCTYITNPGYPSTYSTTGKCEWTVSKTRSDICQLRLDFETMALNVMPTATIAANANLGCCGSSCAQINIVAATPMDGFTATGQTGKNPPVICGINTGYHMYVEVGAESTDTATLNMYLGSGATGSRQWNVKVAQITCTAAWRVPSGCVQYFTGITDKVASYGHQSAQLLQKQAYNNCIRQAEGYCSMLWKEVGQASLTGPTTTSPDPFSMTGSSKTTGLGENDTGCTASHVFISGGNLGVPTDKTYLGNTFCGEALACDSCLVAVTAPATRPTPASTDSFYLGVWSDSTQMGTNPTKIAATGFNLRYYQQPCGSTTGGMP